MNHFQQRDDRNAATAFQVGLELVYEALDFRQDNIHGSCIRRRGNARRLVAFRGLGREADQLP